VIATVQATAALWHIIRSRSLRTDEHCRRTRHGHSEEPFGRTNRVVFALWLSAGEAVALHIKTRPFYSDANFADAVRTFARQVRPRSRSAILWATAAHLVLSPTECDHSMRLTAT
jgi:hypothetical protein